MFYRYAGSERHGGRSSYGGAIVSFVNFVLPMAASTIAATAGVNASVRNGGNAAWIAPTVAGIGGATLLGGGIFATFTRVIMDGITKSHTSPRGPLIAIGIGVGLLGGAVIGGVSASIMGSSHIRPSSA
jgi:hypothetical protein